MSAEVVLRKEKNPAIAKPAIAEVTLFTKGHIIRTEEREEDMYAAIDVAAAKVERQLRKYKTRVLEKRANGKKLSELPVDLDALIENENMGASDEDENQIVRVKEIDLVALTEEEAMIQIDLLGHDFFMYSNSKDGSVNVIYRRKDGSYGILMPRIETLDD
jgi:putative sigma-54 modulation protein